MRTGIPLSAKVFWHDTIMNDQPGKIVLQFLKIYEVNDL